MSLSQYFRYQKNELTCEGVRISDLARKTGTPFYLYSQSGFESQLLSLKKALSPLNTLVCYAVKANSNIAILKTLVRLGAGMDVVSGGELYRALKAGCPPNRIVFAGVGKSPDEIRQALRAGIFSFNAESLPELESINREAGKLKRKARVALRINPDVEANTHKKITTGKAENKFGLDFKTACKLLLDKKRFANVEIKGLHIHIGSQITTLGPFKKAFRKVLKFADLLNKAGVRIDSLDLGGGLGILYQNEKPVTAEQYGRLIVSMLKRRPYKVLIEPGRFISGNAGVLVTRVLYRKRTPHKNFVVVDAAMNDLMRPAIYEAYHEILPVSKVRGRKSVKADVVGPICETGDVLAHGRKLQDTESGELLSVMSAGAYGFSMASNYNSRPRPAEVLVKGKTAKVIRKRETYQDLISGEKF